MSKLDSLKEVGSRIRWRSVLAVAFVILVVIIVFSMLPGSYNIRDNIGLAAYATPGEAHVGGKTTLNIEVKNVGHENDVNAVVVARAYDDKFIFTNTSSTMLETILNIGPKETRKLSYELMVQPGALEGVYRIDVTAKAEDKIEGAKEAVYVEVTT